MPFTIIVSLLQAAITLLTLVQSNPSLPQATRDNVIQSVQQSMTLATVALSTNLHTTTASCPPTQALYCPTGQHVQTSTDANGCKINPTCVLNTSCPVYSTCSTGTTAVTSVDPNGCTKINCAPVSQPTGSFVASPTSGGAPLTVTFSHSGPANTTMAVEQATVLDFGDGTKDDSIPPTVAFTRTHTYTSPGTYAATLKTGSGGGTIAAPLSTIGTVTITVAGEISSAPSIRVTTPNGGETLNAGTVTTLQWDASNIPATAYFGSAQVSYKIGLKLINPMGEVVGYIPLGSDLFDGTARSTQWDPASLSGGFSALNQLKVRASVIKQINKCVSAAAVYSSLATSPIACISEETVASDDSDGWFSVKGATVCNPTVTPMTCTAS